jgi:hypothetical protein
MRNQTLVPGIKNLLNEQLVTKRDIAVCEHQQLLPKTMRQKSKLDKGSQWNFTVPFAFL